MSIIASIVTPAVVAAIISLLVNIRTGKLRDYREYTGSELSATRELIEKSIKAAAEYYSLKSIDRKPIHEAQVWLFERELRFSVPQIISQMPIGLAEQSEIAQDAFDDFISQLTGGSFQSKDAGPDLQYIRRIAVSGSELRARLNQIRQEELKGLIDRDPISRLTYYWNNKGDGINKLRG
jgi:hypothetical protein